MAENGGPGQILVINPNSNPAVTAGISEALEPYRMAAGPEIVCETLEEGPIGIESQSDVDAVIAPLAGRVGRRQDVRAFVIACYSDPGIDACREATDRPVFGIQQCGVLAAMARARQFGVIALSEAAIARHKEYLQRMGVLDRLAAERPAGLSVAGSGEADSMGRLEEVGRALRDEDSAGAIILGCTGMAARRAELEARLGIPVIDPTQAAVGTALSVILSGRN